MQLSAIDSFALLTPWYLPIAALFAELLEAARKKFALLYRSMNMRGSNYGIYECKRRIYAHLLVR